jgi:hypothetical protein
VSLARPGGNVTGVTTVAETLLTAKRLELIKEAAPGAARIAVLAVAGPQLQCSGAGGAEDGVTPAHQAWRRRGSW